MDDDFAKAPFSVGEVPGEEESLDHRVHSGVSSLEIPHEIRPLGEVKAVEAVEVGDAVV